MLLKIFRGNIFVHDTYVFINIFTSSLLKEIPFLYAPLSIIDKKKRTRTVEILLSTPTSGEDVRNVLKDKFYDRIERIREEGVDLERAKQLLSNVKSYPSIEYMFRAFPRELLEYFVKNNYIWLIPFKEIYRLITDGKIIEILYRSPILNNRRIVRLRYDQELYELLKTLCIFNNNPRC
ncbi:YtxH domain-containing protein [Staphylothermus hellenicus]|uniref:Uncharacterized protein n=1 Tax=Staphylothermus hellenicus (strain DSM 12710 / JCM 10830 / BK20S6-10-b1 / P8) TaxID=591019 RepID=D7DBM4_STAHD|nr:YtxH domain-containing protein [Staphylothermus hellenicus]ADI31571.1 hypothetical protein Shell_0440 [Staphylothermus hellenicus DSM 12710]